MSTKIEDLSDTDSDISFEEERKPKRQIRRKRKQETEEEEIEEEFENYKVLKFVLHKTKDPILVTLIMMFLTNKLLKSGINRIPGIESVSEIVSINVILSILAGIIFFFTRELF
jgi:hypothetical protein